MQLNSRQALLREGGVLQNCLGEGEYDEPLAKDECMYLVLRDERSRSHAVAEVMTDDNMVWDIRGKQNLIPKMKYLAPFAKFFAERQWPIMNRWKSGIVIDDLGHVHSVNSIPDRLSLRGDLEFFNCRDVVLPRELNVTGLLTIRKSKISQMSDQMSAGGVIVGESSGPALATTLYVGDVLELKPDAEFSSIAEVLAVDGPLQLTGNQFVKTMPSYLRVADWLQADGTSFERFGDDTQILGCLDVHGAQSYGGFTLDADRNVVHLGDMVEIIGSVKGINERRRGVIPGKFGSLMRPIGIDGGIVEFPGETQLDSLALIATAFRKVPSPAVTLFSNQTVRVEDGSIVVDLFTPEETFATSENGDVYDPGEFFFDLVFAMNKDAS